MDFSIATWNINSVRLRLPLVADFLKAHRPDVLCLQETNVPNDAFPSAAFRKLGYEHHAIHGQKGYHGVATISRHPLEALERRDYCSVGDSRHLSVIVPAGARRIRLHNFYVPAGGDEPDRAINPKFAHKLDFLEEMKALHAEAEAADGVSSVLVGDLNIAPLETDVWSHKQLLKVVSHTPVETAGLLEVLEERRLGRPRAPPHPAGGEDLHLVELPRARLGVSDRGRRLDHIWASADLAPALTRVEVLRHARGWERPSDHVPVIAHFDL